jgi:hypothetical protein
MYAKIGSAKNLERKSTSAEKLGERARWQKERNFRPKKERESAKAGGFPRSADSARAKKKCMTSSEQR